jgi:tellurite resistance protein
MNSISPAFDSSLLPSEDHWAAEVAASLRLLQAAGAAEPAEQREAHIEEQVRRALQTIPAAQRARCLERLATHFPVGQMVGAPSAKDEPDAAAALAPQTPDEVAALVSEAWGRFSPEERRVLRERLTTAGVVEPAAPAEAADFSETKRSFGLAPNETPVPLRLGRLLLMQTDFLMKLDQLAWGTWKQVSAQTPVKRDNTLGDLRTQMRRYLKGDADLTDQQMALQIERTRHLTSSLLGSLAVTSRGFVKRYQTRYAPDAVQDIVKMEGGLGAFGNEGKFWRKYKELASEINDLSIQTDMMETIARFVEDMMKAKKPGTPV